MAVIYDRKKKIHREEKEVGGKSLRFLYESIPGRMILKQLVRPGFSNWRARQNQKARSAKKVQPFAKKHGIDLAEAEKESFVSFHDFFIRKLKPSARPIHEAEGSVIAVADGKLTVYPITSQGTIQMKQSTYTWSELLRDEETAAQFEGGTCWLYRLALDDYHRYAYPDRGRKIKEKKIPGILHTVRPLAHRFTKVFAQNTRQWQLLETEHFGKVLYLEVGAMLVGKMHDHGLSDFHKGQEKGYFEYGASSILLCFQKDVVRVDADIWRENQQGIEVQVRLGEKVGERNVE